MNVSPLSSRVSSFALGFALYSPSCLGAYFFPWDFFFCHFHIASFPAATSSASLPLQWHWRFQVSPPSLSSLISCIPPSLRSCPFLDPFVPIDIDEAKNDRSEGKRTAAAGRASKKSEKKGEGEMNAPHAYLLYRESL